VGARVVVGHAPVVREVRAAGPLMAALAAPVTARAPWLTVVLNSGAASRRPGRPIAVVVDGSDRERPDAAAFLELRRRGARTVVTLLGDGAGPQPGGGPTARLLARDETSAALLAAGIAALIGSLAGPWSLRLTGLPLGDPVVRRLAAAFPTSTVATLRTRALVDGLDGPPGAPRRTAVPAEVDQCLPGLLGRVGDRTDRRFLRAAVRLHAAIGQVEIATGDDSVLLTLLDGAHRWPWWGAGAGLSEVMGAPLVQLTASGAGRWADRLRAGAGQSG
jgi:hypothetical protein